jgi:HTH-type transcriptional regulator, global nitrogen regulator NrpRI
VSAQEKKSINRLAILNILNNAQTRLHSDDIALALQQQQILLNERTIRLYLTELSRDGLCESIGRKGVRITEEGRREFKGFTISERVGYMSAHIDRLTWLMDYSLPQNAGTVAVNVSIIPKQILVKYLQPFLEVFKQGYAMGELLGCATPGQTIGTITVPPRHLGICTVCSITLNRMLFSAGIPVRSLFSGLLDIKDHKPHRVKELIAYSATSINPLQLFIQAGMTDYLGAIRNGNGRIGIGFREVPAECYEQASAIATQAQKVGLGAFMEIGAPNIPLLNMPVSPGYCGIIVVGGLNPAAIFYESGVRLNSQAATALLDREQLFHYSELEKRYL